MDKIISVINNVDEVDLSFLILIPWFAMYYIAWHFGKEIDR
jgi:hypothetical protein